MVEHKKPKTLADTKSTNLNDLHNDTTKELKALFDKSNPSSISWVEKVQNTKNTTTKKRERENS